MKTAKIPILTAVLWILILSLLAAGCSLPEQSVSSEPTVPTEAPTEPPTEPPHIWETGYIAGLSLESAYCGEDGEVLGTLLRGTEVEYEIQPDGRTALLLESEIVYLQDETAVVSDPADIIPAHTLYVRTPVNLRDPDGRLLEGFADKGTAVEVTGYDYLREDGTAHMYQVSLEDSQGYIMPWYLTETEEEALSDYDNGSYAVHAAREDRYGGGGAANLDYFPREKGPIEGNEMPQECRTLYLNSSAISHVEDYLEIAEGSGINAFVVDISNGSDLAYAAEVMTEYCPSGAAKAHNSPEDYQAAVQKLRDAGYYVIGRITAFNDYYFVKDHPEYAITKPNGDPLKLSGEYWPTPYSRDAWQYKVDLAVEAVEMMGFDEIQFDYVRFPNKTRKYEKAGTIDFHNTYGETKAQAIQRFLMYAADILHEHGAYVSADVYGESAYTYVTAYGQYWAAISNVVDVISGMPYPDHFGASGSWIPWKHPYDTLHTWGEHVMLRQSETATPAVVRTWIQAYNAIREPKVRYGADEVSAQIRALRDTGCTGGFMTWNAGSSVDKYRQLMSAFAAPGKGE